MSEVTLLSKEKDSTKVLLGKDDPGINAGSIVATTTKDNMKHMKDIDNGDAAKSDANTKY